MSHPVLGAIGATMCLAVAAGVGVCMMQPELDTMKVLGMSLVAGVGVIAAVPVLCVGILILIALGSGGSKRPPDGW